MWLTIIKKKQLINLLSTFIIILLDLIMPVIDRFFINSRVSPDFV